LEDLYEFVVPLVERKYGTTRQARFNGWNVYYLVKHTLSWVLELARRRPAVAHYAISSGWALEKGLVFLWLARLYGAKTVGHLHAGDFIEFWNALTPKRKRFAERQLARLDAFVVLSNGWRNSIFRVTSIPDSKLFVVFNPIDPEFEKAALQMTVERSSSVLLSLGGMGRDKGIFDILEAAVVVRNKQPNFTIQLVGPEREPGIRAAAENEVSRQSLQECVWVQDGAWGTAKLDLFSKSSILLLPSYIENFPLVVLEAAAAGLAIIATPIGATPEFFEEGVSALFVEPGNPAKLADAILYLLDNPEERTRLAAAARKLFTERLSRSGILTALSGVYSRVLERA
jgi:glycosyltransferase involved in cell wall biosynthesis